MWLGKTVKVNDEATMLDVNHGSTEHILHNVGMYVCMYVGVYTSD
jgi:hypothetical protein